MFYVNDRFFLSLVITLVLSSVGVASEQLPYEIISPVMNGTGCPTGSGSLSVNQGGSSLSWKVSQYQANIKGKSFDRKTCSFVIPVKIDAGYQMAIEGVKSKIVGRLPDLTEAEFKFEFFYPGVTGRPITKLFVGAVTVEDMSFSFENKEVETLWGRCGGEENLRINSSILLKGNDGGQIGFAAEDEQTITFKVRKCP